MNPHIRTRQRVASIGALLVEGPFSIKPPPGTDDYGWLECSLRLSHWGSNGEVRSASVYVDDSTNRESAFLPPIIRCVHWLRSEDMHRAAVGALTWPTAAVTLAPVGEAAPEVDRLIREMQTRLANVPFVPHGLSANRSTPLVESDDRGRFLISSRNGLQSVEFRSLTSTADEGLTDAALDGIATLRQIGPAMALAGWRESYDIPFESADLGPSHWWSYASSTAT